MSRHQKLRPKSHIPGYSNGVYDLAGGAPFLDLEYTQGASEEKREQRVFRVKRKHVLKACDRCRVKKTKCDGKQPCNRCSTHNHPCLFRERKATQAKVYSRGFVEMLESHHSLVVKALQKLYKYCVNREGFPGEPLVEAADGNPLTHAILDRLGLIKQAEETLDEPEDPENPQCTGLQSTSGDSSATTDSSSEPRSPPDPPQSSCNTASSSPGLLHDNNYNDNDDILKWDFRLMQPEQYVEYPGFGYNGTMPSRPSFMGTTSLAADAMYPELSPSVPNCEQPYPFYLESSCTRVDLRPGLMSRPGSHAIAAGLPVEIYALGEFQLPFQEQQFYSAPPNTEPFLDSHWNTNNFHQDPNVQQ